MSIIWQKLVENISQNSLNEKNIENTSFSLVQSQLYIALIKLLIKKVLKSEQKGKDSSFFFFFQLHYSLFQIRQQSLVVILRVVKAKFFILVIILTHDTFNLSKKQN